MLIIFDFKIETLVERSVCWFDQYIFDLILRSISRQPPMYTKYWTASSVCWARFVLNSGTLGFNQVSDGVNFRGLFPGFVAELSEQDRESGTCAAASPRSRGRLGPKAEVIGGDKKRKLL